MAKKNEEVRMKNEEETAVEETAVEETAVEETAVEDHVDSTVVWDLSTLFEMKFLDPLNGQIVMVRRAFKPRGKLEFYCPEN